MILNIIIDPSLKRILPQCSLGIITANVSMQENNVELWEEISKSIINIKEKYTLEQLPSLTQIRELRSSYKLLGKDPVRYRCASEALLRRILQNKDLYKVNTIVDINNLVSIESQLPVGTYDKKKLKFPVTFRIGLLSEKYKGIGKKDITISNLPILADQQHPFGSPTSDSERAMIGQQTTDVMMVIYSFGENQILMESTLKRATALLETFASASQIESNIVY